VPIRPGVRPLLLGSQGSFTVRLACALHDAHSLDPGDSGDRRGLHGSGLRLSSSRTRGTLQVR